MDEEGKAFLAGMFMGGVLVLVVLGTLLHLTGNSADQIHRRAVEAGAAEYYLDDENQRQFRWLSCEEDSQKQEGADDG